MIGFIQDFVRGCIIDPELEKKAHRMADEAHETMRQANATMRKAQKVVSRTNNLQGVAVLAGLGLMVAGFMAGSMSAKTPNKSNIP